MFREIPTPCGSCHFWGSMGGVGAELVLRIEGDGALWSVMADWRRDRVKDLAMGEVWAEAVISEWLGSHGHEAEAAALISPEDAAFWSSRLRAAHNPRLK